MVLASIPSPGSAAWRLGPLPVRAYALCVTAGILIAVAVASHRYRRSGGRRGVMLDVAAWAVPFGLIGAAAHAVMFGLAIGGLSNWWTQQFYGPPSTWWWAVQISPAHRAPGYESYDTFQPAFLYQSLWDVAVGLGVIWAARRFPLSGERTFMLCAACYTAGSFWVESVRVGPLPQVLGVRYGALGDVVVFLLAVAGLYLTRPRPIPPARTSGKSAPERLVDDSPGDVMST